MRSESAGPAAGVVHDIAGWPNDRARRVGRIVRPQREAQERDDREQRERTKSIFRLRSSNIVDVPSDKPRRIAKAQTVLHSLVRSIGMGTSMPRRAYADKLSVSKQWPPSQLCTHKASAVGSAGHIICFRQLAC